MSPFHSQSVRGRGHDNEVQRRIQNVSSGNQCLSVLRVRTVREAVPESRSSMTSGSALDFVTGTQ